MSEMTVYASPQSPWTFLSWNRLCLLAERYGATLHCRPINMGRMFAATGGLPLPKRSPQRQAYRLKDLERFASHLDLTVHLQPRFFPADERLASRIAIAIREEGGNDAAFLGRCLEGVWQKQENIADEPLLRQYLESMSLDADALIERAQSDAIEAIYESDTDEAITRGVFGVPFIFVDDEPFWGQDRLEFVGAALKLRQDGADNASE